MNGAELAVRYLDALAGEDPDAVADLVTSDFRNEHLSALGEGSTGRDTYRRRLPGFFAQLVDRRYRVDDLVEADRGDHLDVIVRYRLTAIVDGARIDVPGVMWLSIAGGSIARRIDSWDSLTVLRQTGAAPEA
jgi:ketosteroid isomerase-like protein